MALIDPEINVKLGNKGFADKIVVYKNSTQLLTRAIAKYPDWGPDQIEERQAKLADLAVKIWDR